MAAPANQRSVDIKHEKTVKFILQGFAGFISEAILCDVGKKNGANDRNRTDDLLITSELLYRLSYIGTS